MTNPAGEYSGEYGGEYDGEYGSEYDSDYENETTSETDNETTSEHDTETASIITADVYDADGNRKGSYVGVIQEVDTENDETDDYDEAMRDHEDPKRKKYKKKYGEEDW